MKPKWTRSRRVQSRNIAVILEEIIIKGDTEQSLAEKQNTYNQVLSHTELMSWKAAFLNVDVILEKTQLWIILLHTQLLRQ